MQLPYSDKLNTPSLARIFDNKSESYKLFWFKAIMYFVKNGRDEISYSELIDKMIADAWYMVSEFHLNLGPSDALEKVVKYISETTGMLPSVKEQEILNWLKECDDQEVKKQKRTLSENVPYRLQATLMDGFKGSSWNCGSRELALKINQQKRLMYYFMEIAGMQTRIKIDSNWMQYLLENRVIIEGWIEYNMIIYLQRRNPSVPGISDKLAPPLERKLEKVKKYWKIITSLEEFHEIYGNNTITSGNISIDHFVPWSYVAHDEFWNLHPTTRAINSSKSNNLPEWEKYFPMLADIKFHAYSMIWEYDSVRKAFEECKKDHFNDPDIVPKLYHPGLSSEEFSNRLEEIIYPVYLSAENCGFKPWEYNKNE